ncbi:hypothetical protein A2U01_0048773, partial [Trifolium medium]|nr:hypothetical protein [Trifolium medium]
LEKLRAFVDKFQPTRYVTKTGVPVLNRRGKPRFEARHINKKTLLECKSRAKHKLLLDNMANFADELLKIVADQKGPKQGKKKVKSRTSVVLEQSVPVGSSSPGGVSSSLGGANTGSPGVKEPPSKRQREEDPVID